MSKRELGGEEGLTALRVMYELNPEGIVFTHADEGHVLAANPAACAILGMSEEEILRHGATASRIPTTPLVPRPRDRPAHRAGSGFGPCPPR